MKMKEAAAHQIEVVADATSSFEKGIKKSFKRHSKEVRGFARSFGEFVDVEDILKSIHKVAYPSDHAKSTSIIHPTIDWSKYPPGTVIPPSEYITSLVEEPAESTESESAAPAERKKSDLTRHTSSPSSSRLNPKGYGSIRRKSGAQFAHSTSYSNLHDIDKLDSIPTTTLTQEYAARHLSARKAKDNTDTKLKETAPGFQRVSRDHSDIKQSKQYLSLFNGNNKPIRRHSHTNNYVTIEGPPEYISQSNLTPSSPTVRRPKMSLTGTTSGKTKSYLDLSPTASLSSGKTKSYLDLSPTASLNSGKTKSYLDLRPTASFQRSPSMNDITRESLAENPLLRMQDVHASNNTNNNASRNFLDVNSLQRRPSDNIDKSGHVKSPLCRSASARNSRSNSNLFSQISTQNPINQKSRMCTRSSSMRVAKRTSTYV